MCARHAQGHEQLARDVVAKGSARYPRDERAHQARAKIRIQVRAPRSIHQLESVESLKQLRLGGRPIRRAGEARQPRAVRHQVTRGDERPVTGRVNDRGELRQPALNGSVERQRAAISELYRRARLERRLAVRRREQELIVQHEAPGLSAIAEELGYDSTSAFVYMFRTTLGITPGRYYQSLSSSERSAP
jgi:AraC-like DNA-binding protein